MTEKHANSPLARALRVARRNAGLSQGALAAKAGVAARSAWQAEQGRGTVENYTWLAAALGMEITGRALPPGDRLGTRLQALRLRQRKTVGEVAAKADLDPVTLAAIEAGQNGHLASLESVAATLGAGLMLVPQGEALAFFTGAGTSSAYEAWTTPPDFLERLYAAIGSTFDLDPCSPGAMLSPVRARTHFTRHDDGLAQDWLGRVYMNPPYGRATPSWTAKARREVEVGNATLVIGLIGARTDTRWWHNDVAGHAHAWILRGRLAFGDGRSVAPFASALTMWGGDDALAHAISAEFPDAQYITPMRARTARTPMNDFASPPR